MEQLRVLLVEDDPLIRIVIESNIRRIGADIRSTSEFHQARELLASQQFDVVITDIHLPEGSGIDVLAAARKHDHELALIVITSSSSLDTAISAINHGIFAYMRKPITQDSLIKHVIAAAHHTRERRHLRSLHIAITHQWYADPQSRSASNRVLRESGPDTVRSFGPLEINSDRRTVLHTEQEFELSSGEMNLLLYLADRSERVIRPDQIVRDVFGYECSAIEARDLVKARIHKLRRKIEVNPTSPKLLISIRGAGYMLTTRYCR